MSKETLVILISVLSTPVLGAFVSRYFERNKTKAETHNINIGGEITLGEGWQKYALQQKQDKEELRKEFNDKLTALQISYNKTATDYLDLQREFNLMKTEFEEVKTEKEKLAIENRTLVERVKSLETQVSDLQSEVAKYKGMGEHAVEVLHQKIDEASSELLK